ncbi:MAG: ABC transporter permease [Candidatus Bathyarchaeia archaeon]
MGSWTLRIPFLTEDRYRTIIRFKQNKLSVTGLLIMLIMVLLGIFAPYVAPYSEDAGKTTHIKYSFSPPSWEHPFGTDEVGRDVLSRVIFGTRISLVIAVEVVAIAMIIGVPLGLIAGYVGGTISTIIMRLTDIFLAIPPLIFALITVAVIGPSLQNAIISIALFWWPWYVRLMRGEVISVKEEEFIEAAEALGAGKFRIIFREILPNVISPLTVKATLDMGFAILQCAALGFLGLGAQAPLPEWGTMLGNGRAHLPGSWWLTVFPGMAIFLTILAFQFLGDGLRDIFDVKLEQIG